MTTVADEPAAAGLAERLVTDGLAACAHVDAGIRAWYRWQGALECDREVTVRLKVRHDRLEACCARLRELHPYEVPMILAWPVTHADAAYLDWAYGEGDA
jgi:periplasmic divalent cation tolerance protein